MSIQTIAIGGDGGKSFEEKTVRSIGFRSGERVDAIILNGERHGGNGGKERPIFEMQSDEYIDEMTIWRGGRIHRIKLTTSRGRAMDVGQSGGKQSITLKDIRVLGIGGKSGEELDKLRIRYIENYKASDLIETGVSAVVSVIPQGQRIEVSTSQRVSKLSATRQLMETVFRFETSTETSAGASNAFGEFSAKVNTTFGLEVTSQTEINEQVETEETSTETMSYTPPRGQVGLEIVQVDVFRSQDGLAWMFPTTEPAIVSVSQSEPLANHANLYDMTGLLGLHIPAMAGQKTSHNGYDYFRMTD
ncbi:jacalin-like lectin [Pseudooceanicola algae]|uniref:Uncharacterized protein n=1 Tax=Pseudooceanicola algae TaxID=1537215 RepID=A0A418SK17_9RHOB|nr:hypothetical protein [Pseudooceanicola algae]QPM92182.1 hypothetical protein PSAL_034460 [Pseudooceanicola algae]